jgi:hypothetical protein
VNLFAKTCSTLAVTTLAALTSTAAQAQEKMLRIAMTAADIPRTLGQPDQGFEGYRFTGIPIYDARGLVEGRRAQSADLRPGHHSQVVDSIDRETLLRR